MVWLGRGGGLSGVSTCFGSGCKSYEGGGVGNVDCLAGGCAGLDGVELISMGERLRCRGCGISVRKSEVIRQGDVTSVMLGSVSTGGTVGGLGEGGWGTSKIVVCGVVVGCCGDEASDIGSGSGVVPTLM